MNPQKCTFRVSASNFLKFLVRQKGIKIDQNKIQAIVEAQPPKNKKELKIFIGKINFSRRFMSNCSSKIQRFSYFFKFRDQNEFRWESEHQEAFDRLNKGVLDKAIDLNATKKNESLKLYISTTENFVGRLLAQDNEFGKE